MIPIVLHTTNRATAAAIRSANGMVPGLRGNDLLLESRQQPLPFGQGQPQMGDLSQIIRPGNRRNVDGLFLTVSLDFHQPHNPSHALTPDQRPDAKLPLRRPHPQSPGSPSTMPSSRTPPSAVMRPPSKAAVSFLRPTAGNQTAGSYHCTWRVWLDASAWTG